MFMPVVRCGMPFVPPVNSLFVSYLLGVWQPPARFPGMGPEKSEASPAALGPKGMAQRDFLRNMNLKARAQCKFEGC